MFLCCPISAASGSHFLLATNHSAFILTVFRRCEGNRQYRIILSADTASEVRQLPERCLSRKAGIMRCCQYFLKLQAICYCLNRQIIPAWFPKRFSVPKYKLYYLISLIQKQRCIPAISHHVSTFLSIKQHANLCPRSLHINFRLSPYPAKSHRLVGRFNSKSYNMAHICHFVFRQYRIILSADTASEVRQLLSQKRR